MTATPNPRVERAPLCPCHGWPMLERVGQLGWVCLWCGRTVEWDGRPGRWRDEEPSTTPVDNPNKRTDTASDVVECGPDGGPAGLATPGPWPTRPLERWST
jgi:hypothetical protein